VGVRSGRSKGSYYEDLASAYLERKGYRILDRNVHLLRKEVDIVAADRDTIVFVEVKGRRSRRFGTAFEAIGSRKRAHIVKLAGAYLGRHCLWDRQCRFDVLSVILNDENHPEFEHIENAFGA
jgi:putative endonuclease